MKNKGRHPQNALTTTAVRNTKAPGLYPDGNTLYLLVDKNGAKRWVQRIVINGKRRDLGLGSISIVQLAEARDIARENRKVARSGGDPLTDRRRSRAILSFEEAAHLVWELHKPTWKNSKHAAQWISTLKVHVFPIFGQKKIDTITSSDVLTALSPIWTAKPETAARVRQRIGTVMKWAIAKGWRVDNPADTIATALPKHKRSKGHHRALPYEQVAGAITKAQDSAASISVKLGLEFLVLTATRSGEIRNAIWPELDLSTAIWTIPSERIKTGKVHRIPLPSRCIEILKQARALRREDDLVFPGTREGKPLSDATFVKLLRDLDIDCVAHGFRTSFRTWAAEQTNIPREVCEFALAHIVGDEAERAYQRSDLFEKRRLLMDQWAYYLESAAT